MQGDHALYFNSETYYTSKEQGIYLMLYTNIDNLQLYTQISYNSHHINL